MGSQSERLQLRVSQDQQRLIREAAAARHETVTDYVVRNAVYAATNDLADRRYFELDDAAWVEFDALLSRPPVHKPRLEKLLSQSDPWVD